MRNKIKTEKPNDTKQEPPGDLFLERSLPLNLEAERAILGGIILDNALIAQAADLLKTVNFSLNTHRYIFEAMLMLSEYGMPIDMITLSDILKSDGRLTEIGGAGYISSLIDGVPRTDSVEPYARLVKRDSVSRDIITECYKTMSAAFESDNPEELLANHHHRLSEIISENLPGKTRAANDVAYAYLSNVEQIATGESGARLLGLPTGFPEYDELTSGQTKKKLTVIAARPSVGKTALLCNWALEVAGAGARPLIFSFEMGAEELIERFICALARIDSHRLRHGYLNRDEWLRCAEAVEWLANHPIFIDDSAGLNISEIRARSRRLDIERGIDWVGADYLQLAHATNKKYSREQEVSEVARGFKELAKELNVPVAVTAQLSRAPETRSNHRPTLADLRESGEIEQAADIVAFLYRDEMYEQTEGNRGAAELIVAKHRGGRCPFTAHMLFKGEWTKFLPRFSREAASYQQEINYEREPEEVVYGTAMEA